MKTLLERLTIPINKRDHIDGAINAPISLLEYGDYECPFCGEAYPIIKEIQQTLGNRLCFAFRHFPLTNIHPHAEHAAEAAEAAGAQERFWEMHHLLFTNQTALADEDLAEYAMALGLDVPTLMNEVLSGAYSKRVREDFKSGTRSGLNGTPTFFVNGTRYDGPRDPEIMIAALSNPDDEW